MIETAFRHLGLVAITLVVGGAILWLADRWEGPRRTIAEVTFPIALAIGATLMGLLSVANIWVYLVANFAAAAAAAAFFKVIDPDGAEPQRAG